jgi:hypothetical protein
MNAIRKLDGPPIPMLVDGILSPEQVKNLFADLTAHARGLEIRDRAGKTYPADQACDLLLRSKQGALQLRYHFDGYNWTDTIMHTPQGLRAVRCRHEPYAAGANENPVNPRVS